MFKSKPVEMHRPAALPSLIGGFCFALLLAAALLPCRAQAGGELVPTAGTVVSPVAGLAPMMTNLLANGGFEQNNWMGSSGYSYGALPTGWWVTNKLGDSYNLISMARLGSDFNPAGSSCGTYAATLQVKNQNTSIGLATVFTNEVHGYYRITCSYAGRWTGAGVRMKIYIDDLLVDTFDVMAAKWLARTVITPPLAAGGHTFRLVATNPRGGDNSVSLDSVSLFWTIHTLRL